MTEPQSDHAPATRRLILLGSTGSIGRQTLDVVANLNSLADAAGLPPVFEIVGLAAGVNANAATEQAVSLGIKHLALASPPDGFSPPTGVSLRAGSTAAERLVQEVEADIVLGAVVGSAGLPATITALELGRDIALANKETLVAAGELVVPLAKEKGAALLPVDSEHSALWQSLPPSALPPCALGPEVSRIILTASGGPFRTLSATDVYNATPEQALAHPTWNMGDKVTIDCASLTNKALEVIEAHWLFGIESARIDVLIHPESIIHSLVEFADRSTIAQLGAPDMRTPIQYALTHPERPIGIAPPIDWSTLSSLTFEPPDTDRFPALNLAFRVIDQGGTAGAIFNAANEQAVECFLESRIPFGKIPELAAQTMDALIGDATQPPLRDLDEVYEADREARARVLSSLSADGSAVPAAGLEPIMTPAIQHP